MTGSIKNLSCVSFYLFNRITNELISHQEALYVVTDFVGDKRSFEEFFTNGTVYCQVIRVDYKGLVFIKD